MRTTRLLAAALLALLPTACGDDDGSDRSSGDGDTGATTDDDGRSGGGTPGGGEGDLFVEIAHVGGFVPQGFDFRNLPVAAVYADGTVLAPGATTLQFPGPAVLPVFTGRLDEGAVDDLLAAAHDAGLLDDDLPDLGGEGDLPIADASTTRVTVVVDGEARVVEAYALDLGGDLGGATTGLSDEQLARRAALAAFVAEVNEAALVAQERFDAVRYRVLAMAPLDPATVDPAGPQPNEVDWPAGLPEPVENGCTPVTGDAVAAFEAALERASELTQWRLGDRRFGAAIRVVLPHEPDCPG